MADNGLSPRLRGNPTYGPARPIQIAVYPRACGGTPHRDCACWHLPGLSRACGGTPILMTMLITPSGLSPRLRGNHCSHCKPIAKKKVYPRACGGTKTGYQTVLQDTGLSPRLRGNQDSTEDDLPNHRVYPRACGGTALLSPEYHLPAGLSPRLRGNPVGRVSV